MANYTLERINNLASRSNAKAYLEIGVETGKTFFDVKADLKVAVDPNFQFKVAEHQKPGEHYFEIPSDDFFAALASNSAMMAKENLTSSQKFDIILIDGLHTFEQSFRDFENSLKYAYEKTIWIIDDTIPSDPFSALPDQQLCYTYRDFLGIATRAWHGDVYKTLFAIHDKYPEFSYCTPMDGLKQQTVLWRATPAAGRRPRFASIQEISYQDYFSVLKHPEVMMPVSDAEMYRLVGSSVNPADYAGKITWKDLVWAKPQTHEYKPSRWVRFRDSVRGGLGLAK